MQEFFFQIIRSCKLPKEAILFKVVYEHILFLLFWLLNCLSFYLLGLIFPSEVILGNLRLSSLDASIFASFWLTFFGWTMWEYVLVRRVTLKTFRLRLLYFFFVNSLGIWIISQYGRYTGLGILTFGWVLIIGALVTLLQSIFWNIPGRKLKG